jgi:quercetin dioxygenase-like cupin family protein
MDAATAKRIARRSSFSAFRLEHGMLCDMAHDRFPTTLSAWCDERLLMAEGSTHFGYVYEGHCVLSAPCGDFTLRPGMVFSLPGRGTLCGRGRGIVVARHGYRGFFQISGPTEEQGRLKYIDGCTDSLLIAPVMLGDPCLNLLYFPPGIHQTQHTHPSMRVGIVASGVGACITPAGVIALVPGQAFVIHAEGLHSFSTGEQAMRVIAYHPDSDFGPTHEDHPMINRTIVDGRSASSIEEIRTT